LRLVVGWTIGKVVAGICVLQPRRSPPCSARTLADCRASTIARLKEVWADEHARWLKRERRLGLTLIRAEISQEAIEFLKKRGYEPRRSHASIGQAVSELLSDQVLEAA
jgi:hypothetical protein